MAKNRRGNSTGNNECRSSQSFSGSRTWEIALNEMAILDLSRPWGALTINDKKEFDSEYRLVVLTTMHTSHTTFAVEN